VEAADKKPAEKPTVISTAARRPIARRARAIGR
jgi:hypothetical protein